MAERTHKQNEEWILLLTEIAHLAIRINQRTNYAVFFDYSGHVESVSIEICESKERYNSRIASTEFLAKYVDEKHPWKEVDNAFLLAKRDHLKSILESGDIPIGDMEPIQEVVTTYEF